MKKIALDLDGVVFDSENLYRVYAEVYDVETFKCNNLIDNSPRLFQKRYNWPENEFKYFYELNANKVLSQANIMTGAEIVLPKLNEFFEFIIITARNDEELLFAKQKLTNLGLSKVKIYNNEHNKLNRLLEENVDFIIDDDEEICKLASENGIKGIYFKNAASKLIKDSNNFKVVNNWGEIYKFLILERE